MTRDKAYGGGGYWKAAGQLTYETHSTMKRSNAILCTRMRSATDRSKIDNGCMQKHTREKRAALFLQ